MRPAAALYLKPSQRNADVRRTDTEMANQTLKTLQSSDGKRRAEVFVRADGTCGFVEQVWDEEERVWYPCGRYSKAVCDSADRAEAEARGRISWLGACAP